MAVVIQLRRGTENEWSAINPVLEEGEAGVELDTGRFKMGNGVDAWNVLDYSSGVQGDPGADGSVWFDGSVEPADGLGADGDYYLDTSEGDVYRKDAGAWAIVGNITGPQGETGPIGPPGIVAGNLDGGEPDTVYPNVQIDGGVEE